MMLLVEKFFQIFEIPDFCDHRIFVLVSQNFHFFLKAHSGDSQQLAKKHVDYSFFWEPLLSS